MLLTTNLWRAPMFSSHPPPYLYAPHRLYWGALIFYLIAVAYALPALAEQYLG